MWKRNGCHVKVIRSNEIISANKSEFSLTNTFTKSVQVTMQRSVILAHALIWLAILTNAAVPQEQTVNWQTQAAFQRQLRATTAFTWVDTPLWPGLERLARRQKICIFLDRRVDPGQIATVSARNVPLGDVLRQISEKMGMGICQVDSLIFLGPQSTCRNLPTLAAVKRQQARHLDPAVKRRLFRRASRQWPQLAVPRQILEEAARQADISLEGAERVPHDLWRAMQLPPMSIIDFLSLVTAGFDLSFEIVGDGAAIRLIPAPTDLELTEEYKLSDAAIAYVDTLRAAAPTAGIEVRRKRVVVTGSWQDHQQIRDLLAARRPRGPVADSAQRFDLRGEASGTSLIRRVADQLHLELDVDDVAEARLRSRVKVDVSQATRDQLLQEILSPLDIQFELVDDTLHLRGK